MKAQRCTSRTALSDAEARALESLPEPVGYELDLILRCELESGHRDEHVSLGQTGGDGARWWLSWPVGNRLLQILPPCPTSTGTGIEENICTLPMGHEGVHDFDLD